MQLLGHDGIYLKDAPRSVNAFILPPGGRADVAMRCDISPGIYEMELLTKGRNYGKNSPINATQGATVPNEFRYSQSETVVTNFPIIALLEVVAGSGPPLPSTLPSLSGLPKPCYLADLSEAPQPPQFWLAYGGSEAIKLINNGASGPVCDNNANFGLCVNGMGFNDKMYMNMYNMGDPQETFLVNNGGHPHHQHVNPFQLHMNNVTIAPFMLDDGARSIDINNYVSFSHRYIYTLVCMTRDSDWFRFSRVDFRDEFQKTHRLTTAVHNILFHFFFFITNNQKGYDW